MTVYIAVIRKALGTDYWADVPDIPGCVACGKSIEEAKANLCRALALHLEKAQSRPPARSAGQFSEDELQDVVGTGVIEL